MGKSENFSLEESDRGGGGGGGGDPFDDDDVFVVLFIVTGGGGGGGGGGASITSLLGRNDSSLLGVDILFNADPLICRLIHSLNIQFFYCFSSMDHT